MTLEIRGRLTSQHVTPNRGNLCVFVVAADEDSGEFDCPATAVTLDGATVTRAWEVSRFIDGRHCNVVLRGVDDSQGGIGVRPCEGVELTTSED